MTPHAGHAVLTARNLTFSLAGKRLVHDLDLDVMPGQRWCVLGPNGSGKTTLLSVLAGLREPDSGEVRLGGRTYAQMSPRDAARARALLLQSRRFAFRMSVRDCVGLGRHPHRGRFDWPGAEDAQRVAAAIEMMDLAALSDRDVLELSGGEQQRTHLATMLAQAPDVFLLDEPTTHLDLKHQAGLFTHLRSLCEREGKVVVFSTHELSVATSFSTHAIVICPGGRVCHGSRDALLEPDLLTSVFGFPLACVDAAGVRTFVPQW